jgi:hypothetical protein
MCVRLLEHGMQCRDEGHSKLPEKGQNVAPSAPPENPILMLETDHIYVADVQKIRGSRVRGKVVLEKLETDSFRVSISLGSIVHRNSGAVSVGQLSSHSFAEIGRESGYATLSRHMITD